MKKTHVLLSKLLITILISYSCSSKSYGQTFVGLLKNGGEQFGAIFSMKADGSNFSLHSLQGNTLKTPVGDLVVAPNGKGYGLASGGGANNKGAIFEYDFNTNVYTKKYDFGDNLKGITPVGSLLLTTNGKFYGMTHEGGAANRGVIFEYDYISNVYTKKYEFAQATGELPNGSLMQASNGKLYGITEFGGGGSWGVLFEYDYNTSTYTVKYQFNYGNGYPGADYYSLIEAPNGKLYGTTKEGGTTGHGIIFEYNFNTSSFVTKYNFNGNLPSIGMYPVGSLKIAPDGNFYGLCSTGGTNNKGVIFKYDYVNNTYLKVFDLAATDAATPGSSLLLAPNNKFYGVTSKGGLTNQGVLFEFDYSNNSYVKKFDFNTTSGANPLASITLAPNGKIYGMTNAGGILNVSGFGTIFEYDYNTNIYTRKENFFYADGGAKPGGILTLASNGKLYGQTSTNGINNQGTIFEYDLSTDTYIKKAYLGHSFQSNNASRNSLVQAPNGKFYGTFFTPAAGDSGKLFEYDNTNSTLTELYNFGSATGYDPFSHMLLASNGKLYGGTMLGGPSENSSATIYEYDYTNNNVIVKHDLSYLEGANAVYPLIEASNHKIYSTTPFGGTNDLGVLFEFDYSTNVYTVKHVFDGVDDLRPRGGVIQASNKKLYGIICPVGLNAIGMLYEYDITANLYVIKHQFSVQSQGTFPSGELLQASNGKLYGFAQGGGANNKGVIYEYDYNTDTYSVIKNFTASEVTNGGPDFTQLLEVGLTCTPASQPVLTANNNSICGGGSATLSVQSGQLNNAVNWSWYSGTCGGTPVGTGNTVSVNPIVTTTYFARGEGASCGDGPCGSITIIVNNLPEAPSPVNGIKNVCPYVGTTQQLVYSVPQNQGVITYNWIVPPTVTLLSGQGTNSIVITINNDFITNQNKVIKVSASSDCGTSAETLFYLVAQLPGTSSPIIASSTNICAAIGNGSAITYYIPKVAAASSYNWTTQNGTTSISHPNGPGENDTLVTVIFTNGFTNSNITVQAINSCGTSGIRSLSLTRNNPTTPGLIIGPTNACEYMASNGIPAVYTVPLVVGNTYTWTVPANATGITGQGTNTISFLFPAGFTSGTLQVVTSNGCGISLPRSLNISKLNPSTPGGVDIIQLQSCPNRIYSYSLNSMPSNATSLFWTVPAGAIITNGQGTTSITVSYPPNLITGTVTVQAISNCANSAIRSITVRLPACPPDPKALYSKTGYNVSGKDFEVNIFPNPTSSGFSIKVISSLLQNASVIITDVQGREIDNFNIIPGKLIYIGNKLKTGVYMIQVKQGNYVKTEKVIKL